MIRNFLTAALANPEAPALVGRGWTVSYGALARGMRARAAWLHGRGVLAGDTVALSLPRDPAQLLRQVELFYALAYLGAPILPLYPVAPVAKRAQTVARFRARWLVSADAREAMPGATRLDPQDSDGAQREPLAITAPDGDDAERPFLYDFSSGTTGPPKAVLFTAGQFAARTAANLYGYGWMASDRVVPAMKWPSKAGVRVLLMAHSVGAALVNELFPETRALLAELIDELGVTCIASSPWQVRRLLASRTRAGASRPRLRFLSTAGSFIAPQDVRAARDELTPNLHVAYACTEAGKIAYLSGEDAADGGLVPVPGFEVETVDEENLPLPAGRTGRLRVRASWLPRGYASDEAAHENRFHDGWFYPGDLASIDAAGRIELRGRSDDVINHGGLKILPARVEEELLRHPDVAQAAVVGVPDPMAGEVAIAFVVARRRVAHEALSEHCAGNLDAGEVPRLWCFVRNLPRNAEGKVLRDRLRTLYHAELRASGVIHDGP